MISTTTSIEHLRFNQIGASVCPPGSTFGPRHITDYEFVWIIEGHAVAQYDDARVEAPSGSILLCRPGMVDRYEWARASRTIHAFIHFDFKPPRKGWPKIASWPLIRNMPKDDVIRPLFRYLLALHPLPEPSRSALLLPCLELMIRAFVTGRMTTVIEPHTNLPEPVEKALKLIHENAFQEHPPSLSLPRLAKSVHVTPEHLCRLFQRTLKRTPLQSLRLARLERAAILLQRTNLAIKQVADSTGFASPYHFSRTFQKIHGFSPRSYRRSVQAGKTIPTSPVPAAVRLTPAKRS